MGSYSLLLRDPRWQKKRLSIFNRDNWKCTNCNDQFTTLHVHHLYYNFDLDPWEYPDYALVTLCEFCHKKVEFMKWISKSGSMELRKQAFVDFDIVEIMELVHRTITKMEKGAAYRYMDDVKLLING